jgi:lysophospholipase
LSARFYVTPENPVPDGAEVGSLVAHDHHRLRYAIFPAPTATRGTVVVLTGRNETIEKYFETVRDLGARGFGSVALDWRGQGGSDRLLRDPVPGHVRSFDDYASDLDLLMREVVVPHCRPPFHILAHSTGGLVALLAMPLLRERVSRMILTAPFLGLHGIGMSHRSAHRLAWLMSRLGLATRPIGGGSASNVNLVFETNRLTGDRARFERNAELLSVFPQLGLGAPTFGWVRAACDAIAAVSAPTFMADIRTPILFVAAGADQVVSTRAAEAYARRLPSATLVTIDGARHEILQEADRFRDQFLAGFDAFVPGRRVSAL